MKTQRECHLRKFEEVWTVLNKTLDANLKASVTDY